MLSCYFFIIFFANLLYHSSCSGFARWISSGASIPISLNIFARIFALSELRGGTLLDTTSISMSLASV